MKYDLHIHTKYSSDGVLEPAKIVKIARKVGLDGIAITDHATIKGGVEAKKYETRDFKVIVGSEVMTERGEITGLFLSREINSRDVRDIISEIKEQGGIVIIPHPFDRLRHSAFHPTEEDVKFIDALEVFNSRCVFQEDNRKALEFAKKQNLPIIAGSDAHFSNEIGNAGIVAGVEDLIEAILSNSVDVFGRRSLLLNHALTKALKIWRKTVNYG
ncbi:PHP domain-containing protein [Chloroflexota bacterium]